MPDEKITSLKLSLLKSLTSVFRSSILSPRNSKLSFNCHAFLFFSKRKTLIIVLSCVPIFKISILFFSFDPNFTESEKKSNVSTTANDTSFVFFEMFDSVFLVHENTKIEIIK
ncbi:hypothetical protein D3C86_1889580 [compost metagenome]